MIFAIITLGLVAFYNFTGWFGGFCFSLDGWCLKSTVSIEFWVLCVCISVNFLILLTSQNL